VKRIVNQFLGKLKCGKRWYAVLALCATTSVALPAQTLTTLFSFDGTDGAGPFCGAGPGHQWGLLRYNGKRRGQLRRRRHGLQDRPERCADEFIQLLRSKQLHGLKSRILA
jgi:hypothetical protein